MTPLPGVDGLFDPGQRRGGPEPGRTPAAETTGDQAAGDGQQDRCRDRASGDRRVQVPADRPPGVALPVLGPSEAVSVGANWPTSAEPRNPSPTPTTPPIMPITRASPMTWRTTRRLVQPRAFSVPNSRTRRDTAAIVSRLASR